MNILYVSNWHKLQLLSRVLLLTISLSACTHLKDKPLDVLSEISRQNFTEKVQKQRNRIVKDATNQIGRRYRWGGKTPRQGFDCSGLVYYTHKNISLKIPRKSRNQLTKSNRVRLKAIQAGDLLFFKIKSNASHVAIYIGNREFIHAPSSGKQVMKSSLNTPYWRRRLIAAGHFYN